MIALLISLALLVSMPLVVVATAAKPLPPNCDQSSDDKQCKDFQIIINKSRSGLYNFSRDVLPEIIKNLTKQKMGLVSA